MFHTGSLEEKKALAQEIFGSKWLEK